MQRADLSTLAPRPLDLGRLRFPLGALQRRRELRAARQAADAELLSSGLPTTHSAWRAAELTAPENRLDLARSVARLVRAADVRYLPGATPLNRLVVREESETLRALVERLEDLDRPVTAKGVLLIDRLLTDGYGPLYVPYRAGELRSTLARIAKRLDAPL
jgi:hypothetical protein